MKNSQKGSAALWFIVVILLLVAAGIFYTYTTQSKVPADSMQQVTSQNPSVNTIVPSATVDEKAMVPVSDSTAKTYACIYGKPTDSDPNPYNLNGELAKFKMVRSLLDMHEGDDSLPRSLSELTDSGGSSMHISNNAYLYSYYPGAKPSHYHIGMKIELNSNCQGIILSELKKKSNFDSRAAGYINGFDGRNANILDSHDFNNGVPN